ncbi:MAG: aminoglycoside phosphotransferase family protein [Promethearchaeota archaeon]|jgi:tRNA A-37 threonylcarbamoyl transferase component Bud32
MEKGDVIGRGRTAEVLYWGNNRVLKLFNQDFPHELIDYQYQMDSLIGDIFPNCPKAFEKLEEEGKIGIVYEYVEGIPLREYMGNSFKKVGEGMRMLAEIHAEMHKHEIMDILTQHNFFSIAINKADLLSDDQKKAIITYLEKLPDGKTICHGDMHPENILLSNEKLYVMDWTNVYSGNPSSDVARSIYVLKYGLGAPDEAILNKSFLHRYFFKAIKKFAARPYIKQYLKLTGNSLKEIEKWNLVIFAARLREPVPLEYDNLLKMIHKKLKHLK